jgi:citrate lyase beta subunit
MTLTPHLTAQIESRLRAANDAVARAFPGDPATRQPVHSFYGGAHLFAADVCPKLGKLALRALNDNGPFPGVSDDIMGRVRAKLQTEPVEDYRIDFEDGYGNRPDAEEDDHAEAAARAVAEARRDGHLPPFLGIRIKPFTEEHRARSFRTLDLFLTTLLDHTGGALPPNLVVTLPKITTPLQAVALADLYEVLEGQLHLAAGALKFEFMVETTQSVLMLPEILEAGRGRCTAAHFGTYDYTAANGIIAAHQHMLHPACDFARNMMKVALAGRGIFLSDGGTNIMPVGDRAAVHRGWQFHFAHVRHSLENAFYQGWDLHPAQLVSRYAAVYSFFREGLEEATSRLRNFLEKSAQATLTGDVFDDAATGLGLMNYLNRAVNCGAVSKSELQGNPDA